MWVRGKKSSAYGSGPSLSHANLPSDAGRAFFFDGRRKRLPLFSQLRAPLATLDPKLLAEGFYDVAFRKRAELPPARGYPTLLRCCVPRKGEAHVYTHGMQREAQKFLSFLSSSHLCRRPHPQSASLPISLPGGSGHGQGCQAPVDSEI